MSDLSILNISQLTTEIVLRSKFRKQKYRYVFCLILTLPVFDVYLLTSRDMVHIVSNIFQRFLRRKIGQKTLKLI